MPTIYVLQCEKNRYYIGKTDRPLQDRIEEHFNKHGSEWTKKFKPLKVIEIKHNADDFDEDKYTKIYMEKYGIDKVRGGTYTQIHLPEYSYLALEKELCNASNLCFRCNRPGHFANTCYASTKADGSIIEDDSESEEEYWVCDLCHKEFDTEIEAIKHEKVCTSKKSSITCFRCGKKGHYATTCYVKL